jgi:nucleoside phosphorylase
MSIDKSEITIGIVTALPEEYFAVKAILENIEDSSESGDPSYYTMGQIRVWDNFGGGLHKVALSIPSKMGNNSASAIASHLTRTFKQVKHLFMVGIAGGMPQHVELGDIVVAKRIVQYDFGKRIDGNKFVLKGDPLSASEPLLNAHRYLELQKPQYPWHSYLDMIINSLTGQKLGLDFGFERPENSEKRPSVFCETIGSANTVLKDDQFRDKLFSEDGFFSEHRIYAVEMEGSGIADAATMQGLNFIVIRGICDYCDSEKNDEWHGYATAVASAYTKAVIEVLRNESHDKTDDDLHHKSHDKTDGEPSPKSTELKTEVNPNVKANKIGKVITVGTINNVNGLKIG